MTSIRSSQVLVEILDHLVGPTTYEVCRLTIVRATLVR